MAPTGLDPAACEEEQGVDKRVMIAAVPNWRRITTGRRKGSVRMTAPAQMHANTNLTPEPTSRESTAPSRWMPSLAALSGFESPTVPPAASGSTALPGSSKSRKPRSPPGCPAALKSADMLIKVNPGIRAQARRDPGKGKARSCGPIPA